jgi:hypothetical protein
MSNPMVETPVKPVDREYEHFLRKAREAKIGGADAWSVQSTGEKVAVALVLNRADWLKDLGYTIPEAIERADTWLHHISQVERQLKLEDETD